MNSFPPIGHQFETESDAGSVVSDILYQGRGQNPSRDYDDESTIDENISLVSGDFDHQFDDLKSLHALELQGTEGTGAYKSALPEHACSYVHVALLLNTLC